MRQSLNRTETDLQDLNISYLLGSPAVLAEMQEKAALEPFAEQTIEYLNSVSKILLADREVRAYSDVVTLAFFMRRANTEKLRQRFCGMETQEGCEESEETSATASIYRLGRGVAFHIAPSNVPVNFAYSFVVGLLCGNANIVRVPSKDFPQVAMICRAMQEGLLRFPEMQNYVALLRYGHESVINDVLSSIADIRIIWGGDGTIEEIRKSPLKPRATEITFADRYSIVVIDSDAYMAIRDKERTALDFYNDTYLTDQNACTSPRVVVWTGRQIEEAKTLFWEKLHTIAAERYDLAGVQVVNKLTSSCLLSATRTGVRKIPAEDNLIVRMQVSHVDAGLLNLQDNSGYFFEYDCRDVLELKALCDDVRCQTVSYIGNKDMFLPLLKTGIHGIDRVVPVGKTMDFDFIWDGYNLFERMTRIVWCE